MRDTGGHGCSRSVCGAASGRRGRQDRSAHAAHRQRRRSRPGIQGSDRNRSRDRQWQASRARQPAARRNGRPAEFGRRQGRAGIRRSSGKPVARPAIGHASDHPGQGASSPWCLSILVQLHRHCCCGALRHSLPGRQFGGAEHHRARLQMGVPYNPDRERLRGNLHAILRRHEERRKKDRLDRCGQRKHRLRHISCRLDRGRRENEQHAGRDPHTL